jgi:hypothetical protein
MYGQTATQSWSDQKVAHGGRCDLDCDFFADAFGRPFVGPFGAPILPIVVALVILKGAAVAAVLAAAEGEEFDAGVRGNEATERHQEAFGAEEFGDGVLCDVAVVRHVGFGADVAVLVDTEVTADVGVLAPALVEVSAGFPLLVVAATAVAAVELLREIG